MLNEKFSFLLWQGHCLDLVLLCFVQMEVMTNEVRQAFDGFLSQTEWMDSATKVLAKDKVNIFPKIKKSLSLWCNSL